MNFASFLVRNQGISWFLPFLVVFCLAVLAGGSSGTAAAEGPRLNEFMASNGGTLQDMDGNWPDWIELYNPLDERVSLQGWGLTDNPEKDPWRFPDVLLDPHEHLIVYASGEDRAEHHEHVVLEGGGRDIWDRDDSFAFYYMEIPARSFTFSARLDGLRAAHPWAKAGLMIRANTHVGAAHGSLFLTGNHGLAVQYRPLYRGFSEHVEGPRHPANASIWLRLVRDDTWVHSYVSDDGIDYSLVASVEVKHLRDEKVLVGLALSSHLERDSAQARFAQVCIDGESFVEGSPAPVVEPIGSRVPAHASERAYWELHTDFSLAADGEFLGLYNSHGRLVEGFSFGQQYRDVSFGRVPGTGVWAYFSEPTPGEPNITDPHAAKAPSPGLHPASGIWNEPILIQGSVPPSARGQTNELRYSLDGSIPTENDPLWPGELNVQYSTVLRLRNFSTPSSLGLPIQPSEPVSGTYLIGQDFGLPILSVITDPAHLRDPDTGILLHPWNSGREWERPAEAAFISQDGQLLWEYTGLGLRIHGGASRGVDKKSFRLYWRQSQELDFPLFPHQPDVTGYRRLVVRSGGNDQPTGYDGQNTWTLLRGAVMAELVRQNGGLSSSHLPVIYLLNGELQGVYTLRERIDAYYVENHTGIDPKTLDLLKVEFSQQIVVREGSDEDWQDLLAWLRTADLSDEDQFRRVSAWLDLDDFTDYYLIQIYAGNWDWPQNNMYMFREQRDDARWRFILWDLDDAFGFRAPWDHNTLAWALRDRGRPDLAPPWYDTYGAFSLDATLIMRKLLANQEFRWYFGERLEALLNGVLAPDHVKAQIDSAAAAIRPGIAWEIRRWIDGETSLTFPAAPLSRTGKDTLAQWEQQISDMKQWADQRPDHLRRHWQQYLEEEYEE